MLITSLRATVALFMAAVFAQPAVALTVRGYGSIITVPSVASTSSFTSEIYIHNPQITTVAYTVTYYGGDGTLNPGQLNCSSVSVPANSTSLFTLPALCPGLGNHAAFGRLAISDNDLSNRPFSVYVRVSSAQGDGFSVEGFPIGEIDTAGGANVVSWVNGLKRQAASPGYQTNCFMASLAEATTVTYGLRRADNTTLGTDKMLSLSANQYVRILDIFTDVGAPAGDYSNIRARFFNNNSASFVAFCTVQNNTTFDADFRIAKVYDPTTVTDQSRQFSATVSVTAGSTTDLAGNVLPTVHYPNVQHNWAFYARHPDRVSCALSNVSPDGEGELQLVDPAGNVVANAVCLPSFPEVYLGEKSTRNSGVNGRWQVKVGGCNGVDITAYTLTCSSGNGISTFTFGGARAAEF